MEQLERAHYMGRPNNLEVLFLPGDGVDYLTFRAIVGAEEALRAASLATATPSQSGYHVQFGARALRAHGEPSYYPGGNVEGLTDEPSGALIHGETSAMSNAFANGHEGDDITHLAFHDRFDTPIEDLAVRCCGACRDKLTAHLTLDTLMVGGNDKRMMVHTLGALTFDDLEEIPAIQTSVSDMFGTASEYDAAIKLGLAKRERSVDAYFPENGQVDHRKYAATILGLTHRGTLAAWSSGTYTNAGYSNVSALEIAVQNLTSDIETRGVERITGVMFTMATPDGTPTNVPYRDRQAAIEFLDTLNVREETAMEDLPILVNTHKIIGGLEIDWVTKQPITSQRSTITEMLPFPFRPSAFGMEASVQRQASKITIFD